VSYFSQGFNRQPAPFACHFEGERVQALLEFIDPIYPPTDELLIGKSVVEDLLGNRGKPDEIRAGPRVQEHIRSLRHLILAQVRDD